MRSRLEELKAFLRTRRAAVEPNAVGFKRAARRRTPGLRREEVASLADVGVAWYTWLEQGRAIRVSRDALGRIAHALRLSPSDTEYLFTLAAVEPAEPQASPPLDDRIRRAVDSMDLTPAWAADPLINVVGFNRLADRIYRFDQVAGPVAKNHLWRLFADPKRVQLYGESWERVATSGVGILRANFADRWADPAFDELLSALREFPEFVRLWDAQYTAPTSEQVTCEFYRSDLGHLRLLSLRLLFPGLPGFVLFVLPPADEQTATALRRLASESEADDGRRLPPRSQEEARALAGNGARRRGTRSR